VPTFIDGFAPWLIAGGNKRIRLAITTGEGFCKNDVIRN
jgi:hypothetical protein